MEHEHKLSRRDTIRLGSAGTAANETSEILGSLPTASPREALPLEYLEEVTIYENPKPNLHSRHGFFPGLAQLPSGEVVGSFVMGEAMDAPNTTTYLSRSSDLGKTWQLQGRLYDKSIVGFETNDTMKLTVLRDGTLIAIGYRFHRFEEEPSSEEGFLPGDDIISFSSDGGRTWSVPIVIPSRYRGLLEISGPCIETRPGDLIAVAAVLPLSDGTYPQGTLGVLLRSRDKGRTWDDSTPYFRMKNVTPWESRVCEMQDGRLVVIVWAYDTVTRVHLPNHVVVSHDNGHTWSQPINTGIMAQASNLMWLKDNLLLTIHAHRAENPGLYVRLVDFTKDEWKVLGEKIIWGQSIGAQAKGGQTSAEMFAALRFGQPSLLRLNDGDFLATHWGIERCQGRIKSHRLRVNL